MPAEYATDENRQPVGVDTLTEGWEARASAQREELRAIAADIASARDAVRLLTVGPGWAMSSTAGTTTPWPPELALPGNPYWGGPPRGDADTVLRGDEHSGTGLEWMTASQARHSTGATAGVPEEHGVRWPPA